MASRVASCCALACAAILAAPCLASAALAPGVHANPGGPAGRQYAIPLAQARSAGSGSAALFGAGVTRAVATRSGSPQARTPAPARPVRLRAAPVARTARAGKPASISITPVSKVLGSSQSAALGVWWMLAAAALVAALGVMAALGRRPS